MNIKKSLFVLLTLFLCGGALEAAVNVVTTTPDLASIVREIGKEKVKVEALASPVQNPHFVDAKPSLIIKLMKADLFIETGMELEVGWAPLLLQSSGNRKIQVGARGFLDASTAITPMEVPANPSRAMGDVHPAGNPHFLTDPENGKLAAKRIAQKLKELSPKDAEFFSSNLQEFISKLDQKMGEWQKEMAPFKGTKFVSFHKIYPYFAARFGLVSVGEIEPKPGIPPTPSHTAQLIEKMKKENCPFIFTQPWFEERTPNAIAKQTGAKVLMMAVFPGAMPQTEDYISTVDYNIKLITQTLKEKR